MPGPVYEYALVRVVPRVERDEFVNVGVIGHCATMGRIGCRVAVDRARLVTLAPSCDVEAIVRHVEAFAAVCRGDAEAGPIARLPIGERFHWLVAPRNAAIQTSAVHAGHTHDLDRELARLFEALVR